MRLIKIQTLKTSPLHLDARLKQAESDTDEDSSETAKQRNRLVYSIMNYRINVADGTTIITSIDLLTNTYNFKLFTIEVTNMLSSFSSFIHTIFSKSGIDLDWIVEILLFGNFQKLLDRKLSPPILTMSSISISKI